MKVVCGSGNHKLSGRVVRHRASQNPCNTIVRIKHDGNVLTVRQTISGRECTAVVSEIGFENSANVELAKRYIPTRHAHPPITPMCFGNAQRRAQRVLGPVLKSRTLSVPVLLDVFAGQVCVCKELTLKMGQTYMQRCMRPLIERMERGEIDPCFEKTHWFKIDEAPHAYDIFRNKEDECMKCVLEPQ